MQYRVQLMKECFLILSDFLAYFPSTQVPIGLNDLKNPLSYQFSFCLNLIF